MDGQKIQRSGTVKRVGVLADNRLTWKGQVHGVRMLVKKAEGSIAA